MLQMVHHDMRGAAAFLRRGELVELVQERLGQVLCGDAGRVEFLQLLQRQLHIFFFQHPFQRRVFNDFFNRFC